MLSAQRLPIYYANCLLGQERQRGSQGQPNGQLDATNDVRVRREWLPSVSLAKRQPRLPNTKVKRGPLLLCAASPGGFSWLWPDKGQTGQAGRLYERVADHSMAWQVCSVIKTESTRDQGCTCIDLCPFPSQIHCGNTVKQSISQSEPEKGFLIPEWALRIPYGKQAIDQKTQWTHEALRYPLASAGTLWDDVACSRGSYQAAMGSSSSLIPSPHLSGGLLLLCHLVVPKSS